MITDSITHPARRDWLIPAGLIALSLVPSVFGTLRLAELASGAPITAGNARFVAAPLPVVLHILVVVPFCIVGAFQFSPTLRRRRRGWHRAAGRILAPFGLIAALTGLWMTHFYPWPEGDGRIVYIERLVFGAAMALSIVLGLNAIRRRDYATHGAWMTRAYAIGLGAGTQVLTHLPWFVLFGKPGELPRGFLMGAGWVINVAVAEWVIRKRRARPGIPTIGGFDPPGAPGPTHPEHAVRVHSSAMIVRILTNDARRGTPAKGALLAVRRTGSTDEGG
jgi:uncharacterized membrane protein